GIGFAPLRDVCIAVAFREYQLIANDHGNNSASNVLGLPLHGDDAVKERLQIGRVSDIRRLWLGPSKARVGAVLCFYGWRLLGRRTIQFAFLVARILA